MNVFMSKGIEVVRKKKCLKNKKLANMMDAILDQVLISQEVKVGFVEHIRQLI
jgi:hypothetical protein